MGKTLRGPIQRVRPPPPPTPAPAPPPLPLAGGGLGLVAQRDLPAPATVSIICPTRDRPERMPGIYDVFARQDYPCADLWVLDDSLVASSYLQYIALRDTRVHYVHSKDRVTIGAARNELLRRCGGSVVAHFDDDDHYATSYLSLMVAQLRDTDSDLVKLSAWTDRSEVDGARFVYDGRTHDDNDLWGWGFSYVYRRHAATLVSFPEQPVRGGGNCTEDYPFVLGIRAAGLKTALVDGQAQLAEHVWHGNNNTGWHSNG